MSNNLLQERYGTRKHPKLCSQTSGLVTGGRIAAVLILTLAVLAHVGCLPLTRQSPKSYATISPDSTHDTDKSRAECDRAAILFEKGRLDKAEAALQDALVADVSYAPAHNNLGRIYFDQGKLYLAAWEFEYARRLLPNSSEVTNNLGMVYEAAGQTDRAIEYFGMAVSMDQHNSVYAGNLARALVRADKDPAQAASLLKNLVLSDERPEWVTWARDQLELRQPIRTAAHSQPATQQEPETIYTPPIPQLPLPIPHLPDPASQHVDDLPLPKMPELKQ